MGSIRFNKQRGAWFVDYIAANGERMRQTIGPGEDGRRLAKKVLTQREAEVKLSVLHLPTSQTMRSRTSRSIGWRGHKPDAWLRRRPTVTAASSTCI